MDKQATHSPGADSPAVCIRPLPSDGTVKQLGLICNPNSGRNRKLLPRVEALIRQHPHIHYVPTATEQDIPAALDRFAESGIDVLVINGGDGSVAHVLTHLLRDPRFHNLPHVILLPGGTTNMNVGDVGISGKLLHTVERLIRWSCGELPTAAIPARPIMQVTPGDRALPLYGMLFGSGAVVQAIEYWHRRVKRSGFRDEFSSGLAMIRTIWGLVRRDPRFAQPVSMRIHYSNGEQLNLDVMLMAVSSMRRVFLNFTPFWGTEDGALHMTVIRDQAQRFLRSVWSVFRGRPNRHATPAAGYHSHNIEALSIHMTGAFTMDGDIFHVSEENGPLQIRHYCDLPFVRF